METKGYVHVYTGNGKGKTTAAFGLALRALCAGKGVYVGQFVKSMKYNETKIERLFNGSDPAFGRIRIEQLGRGCFIGKDPESADAEAARKGWARCADLLRSGEYDVVILEELTIALHFGLLSTAVVLDVLRSRHPAVEVVITGRYAPQALIDAGYQDRIGFVDYIAAHQPSGFSHPQGVVGRQFGSKWDFFSSFGRKIKNVAKEDRHTAWFGSFGHSITGKELYDFLQKCITAGVPITSN